MQTQFKKSIWDYLFYSSLIVLTIWLFLKVVGIIHIPVWLEYGVPIGTLIVSFFTVYQGLVDKLFIVTKKKSESSIVHRLR